MNNIEKIHDKWQRNFKIYADAYNAGKIAGFDFTLLLWKNHTKFLLRKSSPSDIFKVFDRENIFWESFLDVVEKYKDQPIYPEGSSYQPGTKTTIWIYWNDPSNMPQMVESCINHIRKNSNGHKVVVVTENTVKNHLQLDEVVWRKYREGKISRTHFCDIVRIALLAQYGGVWMDCTLLLTQSLPDIVTDSDFYTNRLQEGDNHNVGRGRWSTFFIACHKDNLMMRATVDVFVEYWKRYDSIVDYVWMDYIFNLLYNHIPSVKSMIDAVPYNNPGIWLKQMEIDKPYTEEEYKALFADKSRFLHKFSYKKSVEAPCYDTKGKVTLKGRICGL